LEVPTVPLVPTKIAAIEDPSAENRTFNAFIMPRFVTTVAQAPSFSHPALVHGGRRMMVALEYMHARSIAHLDIKTDNVFVNQAGEWWLGDFGSARSFASDSTDTVYSTTEPYYPTSILGRKPSPRFDWYMLCVMLCICAADAREAWTEQFGSPVRDSSIRAYVRTLEGTELGAVLAELLDKHDLLE
jgi:serine/threonine protein kinase